MILPQLFKIASADTSGVFGVGVEKPLADFENVTEQNFGGQLGDGNAGGFEKLDGLLEDFS